MKEIRVWFSKTGSAKYISHLDLNRCMTRSLKKSGIPLWYTQGYSPRLFLSFAVPLSLGFCGSAECMDLRLTQEDFPQEEILSRINAGLPMDIRAYRVIMPVHKTAEIAYASYEILYTGPQPQEIFSALQSLTVMEQIIVGKHTKKGEVDFDILPFFERVAFAQQDDGVKLTAVLPAGSSGGVNPSLIASALEKYAGLTVYCDTLRTGFYLDDLTAFS